MATLDARRLPEREWPRVLEELVRRSVRDRLRGTPPLAHTSVRYQREPKGQEVWQSAATTYELGYGDCEDLAAWLAADARLAGLESKVVIKRVNPRLRHALVWVRDPRTRREGTWDPSAARGMRGKG